MRIIRPFALTQRSVLPGYRLSMGISLFWLGLIVLLPLAVLMLYVADLSWQDWKSVLTNPRVQAAFSVSVISALIAATIALVLGTITAWVLTRYRFYGRALLDALVDIPFALPTAVAGIALAAVYAPDGPLGSLLFSLGIEIAYNQTGIVLALVFIGLPFVVRNIEPVLQEMDHEIEEAALSLGATRIQCFVKIMIPQLFTALISGFALAFARGLGEYGSVIFLAGNVPYISEIVPLAIVTALESYDMKTATILAVLMLLLSFTMLYILNIVQQYHHEKGSR
jgi:sulfate transport system permease protein